MTVRSDAQAKHERIFAAVLELDLDTCNNVYGVSPCTAGRKHTGTAQAGGASSITLAAGASAVDDAYNNMTVRITGGTGSGQERKITDYVGATKVATVASAWTTNPDATSTYSVIDRPNACYNVYAGASPCQDKANYAKGTKTRKYCSRGMTLPPGETIRPYIASLKSTPTEIVLEKGLAMRSQTQVQLVDETDSDIEDDPYVADRAAAAAGSYWPRLIARNPNYAGRFARVKKGYVVSPFDWNTFITELYVIDVVRGPDGNGAVSLVLSDPIKLTDRTKIPVPTDGKLAVALKAIEQSGTAQAGGANTITLPTTASAVDSYYNNMEVYIAENTGAGQRRVISGYVGATRVATVSVAWAVNPDSTSKEEIGALKITLNAGKGAQYADPATSGKNEYVRVGEEVIRYTAKAGDVLSWTDTTYRAQFGTTKKDHAVDDAVQLCRAWVSKLVKEVIEDLYNESGLADTYIDLTQLAAEDTQWLGDKYRITACVTEPEKPSDLLKELLIDANAAQWWSPSEQKVKTKVNMPEIGSSVPAFDDESGFIDGSVAIERLDNERITQSAMYYDLISATENRKEAKNFRRGEIYIDTDAEGANEHNDKRPEVRYSRWLSSANQIAVQALVARRISALRDAPSKIRFRLDPKDYGDNLVVGKLSDLTTRQRVDATGNKSTIRVRVTRLVDQGAHIEAEARSTTFGRRYAFIAPNGYPDYLAASEAQRQYAFIAAGTGKMSNGDGPYLII